MARYELMRLGPQRLTLWDRFKRSITLGPFNPKDREIARYFGGSPGLSGVPVNEKSALSISAVWSAVTMVSDDIASLPLMLYKRLPNGGKDRFESHPLYRLLHDSPNPEMDSMVWRRTMQAHAMVWQNAYAEIERDGAGRPVAIWPLVPERVSLIRENGRLRYRVANGSREDVYLDPEDMLHLVGYSHDGSVGSSMVQMARESMGLTLAAEKFGAAFFGNGATFGGVVKYPGPRPPEMSEKGYTDSLNARHQGVERAHKLLALYNNADYKQVGVPPNEGQFTETRIHQVREIARWFKIPPHKLGDLADATYSNVEQMDAVYLASCIRPWLVLWQQQLSRKLISRMERQQQFIEHETHGFLSVDATSRASLYSSEFNVGSITPNEIRGYENRDPYKAGGDRGFIQMNMIPLDKVDAWWDAEIASKKAPEPPPPGPTQEEVNALQEENVLLRAKIEAEAILRERAETELGPEREGRIRAEQKSDDLSDAVAHLDDKRGELEHALAQALEHLDGAQTALAAEQAERAREGVEWSRKHEEAEALFKGEQFAHQSTRNVLQSTQESERTATERAEKAEAERDAKAADCESLASRLKQSEASREAAATERDAERVSIEDERQGLIRQLKEANDLAETVGQERDAAIQSARTFERERNEQAFDYGERLIEASKARDEAIASSLQANAERESAIQRAEAAERDKAIAEQANQMANSTMQELLAAHGSRMTSLLAAVRALVVEAMGRIIRRETEKARRNQLTPEKLRHWAESFYVLHEDTCCEILQPAVRAHLALIGSSDDPAVYAQALVKEHIAESRKQLGAAADAEPSEFQIVLARMLNRWETQRADAMADRLLTEGVGHVRSRQ